MGEHIHVIKRKSCSFDSEVTNLALKSVQLELDVDARIYSYLKPKSNEHRVLSVSPYIIGWRVGQLPYLVTSISSDSDSIRSFLTLHCQAPLAEQ